MDKNIQFGEEQLAAISKLENFIGGTDLTITLSGSAGTGKTTLILELIKYLEDKNIIYILAAPTHKAKLVLETLTERTASTVHQLLSLQPNLDIFDLDFRELDFLSHADIKKPNQIPYKGVVIIDEASMINDDLFKFIVGTAKERLSKVIFVGDLKQLQPVRSDKLSLVFSLDNTIVLTKIYRQKEDSPVLDLLKELRDHPVKSIEPFKGLADSIFTFNNAIDFVKSSVDIMRETVETKNVLNAKMLAYTNIRVQAYNKAIRKLLFEDLSVEFYPNEILTGYNNIEFNDRKFFNSLDYIVLKVSDLTLIDIPNFGMPINGYKLKLYDTVYKQNLDVIILSSLYNNISNLSMLSSYIEQLRLFALSHKSKRYWIDYYKVFNSFTTMFDMYYDNRVIKKKTFDYGYALTVHKS